MCGSIDQEPQRESMKPDDFNLTMQRGRHCKICKHSHRFRLIRRYRLVKKQWCTLFNENWLSKDSGLKSSRCYCWNVRL
jgi:phage anti-repressor protein